MATTYRVGIIGFGGAGIAHAGYFAALPNCRVTKVFDPRARGLQRAREHGEGWKLYENLEGFWDGLDIVSVCSPDSTHAGYIVDAVDHGVHAYCEKPIADSYKGVRQIREAMDRNPAVLVAAGHQMRFVPLHRKIKAVLESGELGVMSYLEGYYVHDIRERDYLYDDWVREEKPTPLVRDGVHFVDLLRWFAGEEVNEVFAMANNLAWPERESDVNLVSLQFDSGVIGKIVIAHAFSGPQDHSVRLYGSAGTIENNVLFKGTGQWSGLLHSPLLLQPKLLPAAESKFKGIYQQLKSNVPAWAVGKIFEASRMLRSNPDREYAARFYPVRLYEHRLACIEAMEDFVQAVDGKRLPLCGADEAMQSVLVCLAGVESFRSNQPVRVQKLAAVS